MKLNGEEEDEEKMVVGYALTSKKKKSFLKPNFIALARFFILALFIILHAYSFITLFFLN